MGCFNTHATNPVTVMGILLFNARFVTVYRGAWLSKLPGRSDYSIAFNFLSEIICTSGSWVSTVGIVTKRLVE
jgi:hypothetical protein